MTDITKFKNVSLSKKTYSEVGLLSKEVFDVPISLSKTIEYLVEGEIQRREEAKKLEEELKKAKKAKSNGPTKK